MLGFAHVMPPHDLSRILFRELRRDLRRARHSSLTGAFPDPFTSVITAKQSPDSALIPVEDPPAKVGLLTFK